MQHSQKKKKKKNPEQQGPTVEHRETFSILSWIIMEKNV